jgi:hypothetical protein
MANSAILSGRGVIAVEGPDTCDFLQGLITNDITSCRPGHAIYAALLTPQGKILFEFFVIQNGQQYLLDCAAASAADLVKRLGFYRVRAKVQISALADLAVAAVWDTPLMGSFEGVISYRDPRLPFLGVRLIGTRQNLKTAISSFPRADYDSFRVSAGIPDSADLPPDQVFALDAALDELQGVSFSKGCYVGQEVTARMKHRSTARRRFYIAEAEPLPKPGTAIQGDGRELGRFATGTDGRALALVRLDRLADAGHARIEADGRLVQLRKPDWLHD